MKTKKQIGKILHPALLIMVLGVVYAFTVGGQPRGGPTDADLLLEQQFQSTRSLSTVTDHIASTTSEVNEAESRVASSRGKQFEVPADSRYEMPDVAMEERDNIDGSSEGDTRKHDNAQERVKSASVADTSSIEASSEVVKEQPEEKKPRVVTHTVRLGETLTDIARAYGIDVDTILAANQIPDPNKIRSGDTLSMPNIKGVIHEVQRGDNLSNISKTYNVPIDDIIQANDIKNPNSLRPGEQLIVPGAQALVAMQRREALVSSSGQLLRNFSWPVTGRISSPFGQRWGRMHYGLDIAVVTGTPVRAAAAGRITFAGMQGGYGILITIDHGNGIETRYAHNSRVNVQVGQHVNRGDIVAYSGNTGNSTGPHLHFEIRRNGVALDPMEFLR